MNKLSLFMATIVLLAVSCSKNDEQPGHPFKKNYISGAINGNKSPERKSPFIVVFKDAVKASFVQTTKDFPATYAIVDDTLIVKTDDREKIIKFLVKNQTITFASYVALANEAKPNADFTVHAYLGKVPGKNVFAGKSFQGDLYKFGSKAVFRPGCQVAFNTAGNSFGESGAENTPDENQYNATLYNNVAFRYQKGSVRIMGAMVKDSLVYFRESGLYYWGTFR
ncbi:hypothetical protein ACFSPU_02445 [Haoranjiania flava]|uniref:Uncharacterized protein n=1 Tax=Haoranjiania flava TaxID=1856322 RepID=A0AAE3LP29_9BACT|nr:hypothetical protein [Haoranjiania flava]MCU7693090.1 hypothetical protein [Haoranjiania flava]